MEIVRGITHRARHASYILIVHQTQEFVASLLPCHIEPGSIEQQREQPEAAELQEGAPEGLLAQEHEQTDAQTRKDRTDGTLGHRAHTHEQHRYPGYALHSLLIPSEQSIQGTDNESRQHHVYAAVATGTVQLETGERDQSSRQRQRRMGATGIEHEPP